MRPSPLVLAKLAHILDELLADTNIDKLWRPAPWVLLVDLRALPSGRRLLIDVDARHPRITVTERWPETPAAPDRETLILRRLLEGIRIRSVHADDRQLTIMCAPRHDATLRIVVQLAGRYPNIAVFDEDREVVRLVHERPATDAQAPPLPPSADPFPASSGLDWLAAYATFMWSEHDERLLEAQRVALAREVRGALGKVKALIERHTRELEAAAEAESLRHQGDLLKTVLAVIPRKAESIVVNDWDPNQSPVTIPLDPDKSASENLTAIFARYRKLVRTQVEAEKRLMAAWERESALTALVTAIGAATTGEALAALAETLRASGSRRPTQAPPRKRDDAPRLPYRTFTAADGRAILVGRSAKDNDQLTFRIASGRDLFLHARDVPGSHVILRGDGRPPAHEALLDAATLAAWHSSAKDEAIVDVLWTERKHVRRVPGVAGRVTTADPKTITVRVDPRRIERLYATHGE